MVKQYRHVVAFVYKFAHLSYDRGKPRGIQPTERLNGAKRLAQIIHLEKFVDGVHIEELKQRQLNKAA